MGTSPRWIYQLKDRLGRWWIAGQSDDLQYLLRRPGPSAVWRIIPAEEFNPYE